MWNVRGRSERHDRVHAGILCRCPKRRQTSARMPEKPESLLVDLGLASQPIETCYNIIRVMDALLCSIRNVRATYPASAKRLAIQSYAGITPLQSARGDNHRCVRSSRIRAKDLSWETHHACGLLFRRGKGSAGTSFVLLRQEISGLESCLRRWDGCARARSPLAACAGIMTRMGRGEDSGAKPTRCARGHRPRCRSGTQ
jgi:hypothetical protein